MMGIDDSDIMSAEDFFGVIPAKSAPERPRRRTNGRKNLLNEAKRKMRMRLSGISPKRASGFRQIPQNFLFRKLVTFWRNMVGNYQGACRDEDFFEVVHNCFDHDEAIELIETAFSKEALDDMCNSRERSLRLNLDEPLTDLFKSIWNHERRRETCKAVLDAICDYLLASTFKPRSMEPLEKRFDELKRVLKLDDIEMEILMFAYVRDQTCFRWPCRVEDREKPIYYAMALDRPYAEISKALSPNGKLLKFSLLDGEYDFCCRTLAEFMNGTSSDAVERRFYEKSNYADTLPWDYFGDISAKDGEVLKRMVSAGGKCNILLYGAPGTGKTSFARALAKELGREAFEIRQGDDNGNNMNSEARMVGIQVCNSQEYAAGSMMIIDEADELLRSSSSGFSLFGHGFGRGKSTEKGVMNSMLDEMNIPAVWISNAPADAMDESVRRRFDYSICFERLNSSQRVAIWRNQVEKHGLEALIPEKKIEEYAEMYETSAGGISTVLANVKRMAPKPKEVDELVAALMKPHCKLMGLKDSSDFLPAKDYSLDGLNIKGKVGLDRIVKAARNYLDTGFSSAGIDRPRLNILLFGPPGTGKTEFVKHLGKTLNRPVAVMKGSDILNMYVGGSEHNIAEAFRKAEAEHAILFFDEVDGLLQDRSGARCSWEITQVNELLQQMECFGGIMVAATNFSKNLDAAVMRRFTFKLEFDYLDDAGKRLFFERMFNEKLTDAEFSELKELRNLTPGDFRTVRQELFYLGEDTSNMDRISALKEECAVKKDGCNLTPIGF